MNLSERWERVEEVFHAALSQEPGRRDEFLSGTCAADPDLLAEVRSLISAHEQSGSFIDTPAYELMADRLVESGTQDYLGQTLGHYTILTHLGRGGMGDVYLAEDSRLDRKVALKVLNTRGYDAGSEPFRFMAEAKAASSLNHPNIITIYDVGQEGVSHYIATELIDGQTLRHKMQESRLSILEALQIAIQVAGALAEAHASGIVHRDVKPENIMVKRDGLVKVLDFGLATQPKATGRIAAATGRIAAAAGQPVPPSEPAHGTAAGAIMGTLDYMSPEQARGDAVDGQSDIFSLGVVIFEMATGRRPFEREPDREPTQSIEYFDPMPASGIDPRIEPLVRRALEIDKRLRYQTIQELLLDLKKLADSIDPERGNSGAAERREDRGRVYRWAKGLAASCLLAVAALIIAQFSHNHPPLAKTPSSLKFVASWKNGPGADNYGAAAFSPDGRTIAFSSTKSGRPNIWTKELDRADPLQLTHSSRDEDSDMFPVWSPDGQEIGYTSIRNNEVGIWRVGAGGGEPALIAGIPDGGEAPRLLFWSKDAGIYYEQRRNLFCLDVTSRQVTQVTSFDPLTSRASYFSISPERDRVLYVDIVDGRDGIWAFKMDDPQHLFRVTSAGSEPRSPVWLGANLIAFSADVDGSYRVFVGSLDGAEPREITAGDANRIILAASAGGDKLVVSTLNEESDLWSAVAADGQESQLTWEAGDELWPNLSPDGRSLLFQIMDQPANSVKLMHSRVVNKPPDNLRRQITVATDAYDAKWSPTGAKISFLRVRNGRTDIWTVDPNGENEKRITPNGIIPAGFTYRPCNRGQSYDWSPDGRRIAYVSLVSGVWNVYSISADGSDERNISENSNPGLAFSSVHWSPDGKSLAFTSRTDLADKGGKRLFSIWVSNGGPPEIVYQAYAATALVGWSQTGGELIVGIGPEEKFLLELEPSITLARLSLATKSVRALGDQLVSVHPVSIRMSPSRTSIALVCRKDDADNIWIVPTAGGRLKEVTENTAPRQYISGLEWGPDSQVLFYGKQIDRTTLSLIDHF